MTLFGHPGAARPWATVFGLGGYLFGEGVHRIARPIGWAALALALVAAFTLWRFFKSHEEQLMANAEAALSNASHSKGHESARYRRVKRLRLPPGFSCQGNERRRNRGTISLEPRRTREEKRACLSQLR